MKERPILFSAPMVRALLAGTKTQTRRAAKVESTLGIDSILAPRHAGSHAATYLLPDQAAEAAACCPYGQPGDRLWVREAFRFPGSLGHLSPSVCGDRALDAGYRTPWAPTQFEADGSRTGEWRGFDTPPEKTKPGKLRPGIHMPRWASRITLRITGVRVERLQDISEADALAEGVPHSLNLPGGRFARENFEHLWWTINGDGSWESNPWVWVVEFERAQAQQKGPQHADPA
ncbi:hypothetical protein DR66_4065 [Delftia acidovorans]|uniref:hypothetical protein n=1 Tax=Delftia acidovorans TaxID=80866 RepID=UPI0004FFE507|nr:hypothetical protein [Delftia acidovorans]KFJ12764.1 hypothetical protein DR66_4065 [Delftia acidovorans]QQB53399.1 hypothetical protein I6H54_14615 [Delftia acidovorans]